MNDLTEGCPESLCARAKQFITDHFEESLTLFTVAEALGERPSRLSRSFRVEKTSFERFLNQVRVDKAKNFFLNPHYSVAEVSEGVGFPSVSKFRKIFTRLVGESPTKYRARLCSRFKK